jgi:hypothetical protein
MARLHVHAKVEDVHDELRRDHSYKTEQYIVQQDRA